MSLESTPGFKIEKRNVKGNEGLHYEIILTGTNGIAGTADLIVNSLESCRRDTRYEPLRNNGLSNEDKIANITYFHPYEAYERDLAMISSASIKGAAPEELLNMMIDDSSKQGCKAIITLTGRDRMKVFLKKHGFVPSDQHEQEYYKLLIS